MTIKSLLLATGIFPPEVGGPATYAPQLATELAKRGVCVTVVTYGVAPIQDFDDRFPFRVVRIPRSKIFVKHWWRYARQVAELQSKFDAILSFCPISVSVPLLMWSGLKKPLVVRLGGDWLWERALDQGRVCTLREFYEKKAGWSEDLQKKLMGWSLRKHDKLIFTTDFLRDIFTEEYKLDPAKITKVKNARPRVPDLEATRRKFQFLFAGRLTAAKNIERLLRVWKKVAASDPRLQLKIIGSGELEPMIKKFVEDHGQTVFQPAVPHEKLLEEMAKTRALVIPMLTDISPNTALEATMLDTPLLCTQECGIRDDLGRAVFFDPLSDEEFEQKWLQMCDDEFVAKLPQKSLLPRSWSEVTDDILRVFTSMP